MYIKYKNNIHNISNYLSIVIKSSTEPKYIHLIKNDNERTVLDLENSEMAKYVLAKIWKKLSSKTEFYDIDADLDIFKKAIKYNL